MHHSEIDPLHQPYMVVLKTAEKLAQGYTVERDRAFRAAAANLVDTAKEFINPMSTELDVRVAATPLSTRLKNCLQGDEIVFIGDIYANKRDAQSVMRIPNSSANQVNELNAYLQSVRLPSIGTPPKRAADYAEMKKTENERHTMMARVALNWHRPPTADS